MAVSAGALLRGAWYAIEQCGLLLRDAATLHNTDAYSSAVALALFAREKLGRHEILVDFWKKANAGDLPSIDEIRKACDDHEEKQRRGQLSIAYTVEGDGRLQDLLRTLLREGPQSPDYHKARAELQIIDKQMAKRTPRARHSLRLRALYVDLDDAGTEWNRPVEFPGAEAYKCVSHAVNDYSVRVGNLEPELLKNIDPELCEAIKAWTDRPQLPPE